MTDLTDLTTEGAAECREPSGAAGLPGPYHRQPPDPPSALPVGVELTRLVALARLTPAQALEIGASVLAQASRRSDPDAGSSGSDEPTMDQVVVGPDGWAVLRPAANGKPPARGPVAGSTGRSDGTVLADLAGAARLRGRRPDPAAEQLLASLERAATDLPVAGVPAVARMLQEAAAAIDRSTVRAELAALVRAVGEKAGPASGPGGADARPTGARAVPAPRTAHGGTGSARRRISAWLLSVLVLAGVVLLEVAVLRGKIAGDIGLLLDAGRSGSQPSAATKPDGLPIVPPAPASAGTVTGVDLRSLAQCAPGASCPVRLLVQLDPRAVQQVVTWSYQIVDRCTGATTTAPGGTLVVPAAGKRAAVVRTVRLPAAPGVAVLAVTKLPATAASGPVSFGTCTPDRKAG